MSATTRAIKVDAGLGTDLDRVPDQVREFEALGYDGVRTAETNHDPFFPLLLAAEHSDRLDLSTSIAVAFARNPMVTANMAHDLNAYSRGRFTLGLGSQIKPHITKRFSMPWAVPAPQMREFVLALRAIWANWYRGEPLEFVGKHYRHTLMTPAFTPHNTEHGEPRVLLAAVGPGMTEVAGEVADGMIIHPFSNVPYIEAVTLPAIERGLAKAGRSMDEFEISYGNFVVTGRDEEDFVANRKAVLERIGFYGSTPAYRGVLEAIGAGELQPELNRLSKQGQWEEMGRIIPNEVLEAFAVVAEPPNVAGQILARYGAFVDRTSASYPTLDTDAKRGIIAELRSG